MQYSHNIFIFRSQRSHCNSVLTDGAETETIDFMWSHIPGQTMKTVINWSFWLCCRFHQVLREIVFDDSNCWSNGNWHEWSCETKIMNFKMAWKCCQTLVFRTPFMFNIPEVLWSVLRWTYWLVQLKCSLCNDVHWVVPASGSASWCNKSSVTVIVIEDFCLLQ